MTALVKDTKTYTMANKRATDKQVSTTLDEILCLENYPVPNNIDLVELREYDRTTGQVFLWVTTLFTKEEWDFIEKGFREKLHGKTRVSVIRSNYRFGKENETTTDPA